MANSQYLPKWLKKTQHNSWEPEIFISGIVLYGLLQLPAYLQEFLFYFKREVFGLSSDIDNLIGILTTGIQWMTFGLILHLFFRGIWIGLVGLSYVFPKGIDHERLNYKGKFKNKITLVPDFTNQIIKLEKISSSIFSISYLIFMCILSCYVFLAITIILPLYLFLLLTDYTWADIAYNITLQKTVNFYAIAMVILGCIYLFDFMTLGALKRIRIVNKVYYPLYVFMSAITFSSLYRNIYYILISNFKRWKVMSFLVLFAGITVVMINLNVSWTSASRSLSQLEFYGSGQNTYLTHSAYQNMEPSWKDQRATIQSDIVKDDVLRLFISQKVNFQDSIRQACNFDALESKLQTDSTRLECVKNFFIIELNDSTVNSTGWRFHKDPQTGHRGMLTYVDISNLEHGPHELKVNLRNWFYKTYTTIPFYKE